MPAWPPILPCARFSFCFRQPYPAPGGGWCPGWPQATPKGPQGLDTSRRQRTLSRLEAKTPHWQTTPAPSRHPRPQPRPVQSRCSAPHPGPRPQPSHPQDRQESLISPCTQERSGVNLRASTDASVRASCHHLHLGMSWRTYDGPRDRSHLDKAEQEKRHKLRSCHNQPIRPSRRSPRVGRVLNRHGLVGMDVQGA